jgi:hypothetical protein
MPLEAVGRGSEDRRVFENSTTRPITFLLILAVLLPAIAAFGILYRRSLSVPYQDDYDAILAFALRYGQLPTLKAKVLEIATLQHNEYKLGFEHSVVAAELELTHHLNFTFLTVLGDLLLLPLGYLLWRTYQQDEKGLARRLLAFLPISLLFFSLTYWENLNWATTGLQNTPVILFGLLAIFFIAPGKAPSVAHLLLGCLAAALAAFTSANGFLLGPVGLWILLARRAYAGSVAWCASFILPLAAYLYHFTPSVYVVQRFVYITRPLFFLGFIGCAVPFRWVAAPLGLVLMSIFVLAVRSRFDRTNPVAFYFTVWIVATGCLVAWVRGAGTFVIASRYSMYSSLMLIFCYSFLAQYLPGRWSIFNRTRFYVTSIVLAVCFCCLADVYAYKILQTRRRSILAGIESYRANPQVNSPLNNPEVEQGVPKEKAFEQGMLTEAIQKGVYTLPPKQEIH